MRSLGPQKGNTGSEGEGGFAGITLPHSQDRSEIPIPLRVQYLVCSTSTAVDILCPILPFALVRLQVQYSTGILWAMALAQLSARPQELGVKTVGTEALLEHWELPFTVPFAALSL